MQGKSEIFLDASNTLPHLKVKYSCGSTELKVEKSLLFWHLKMSKKWIYAAFVLSA